MNAGTRLGVYCSFACLALPREAREQNRYRRGEGVALGGGSRRKGSNARPDCRLVRYDTIDTLRYAMKSRLPSSEAHDVSHAVEVEPDQRATARARFQQEAEKSWLEFQNAGLHLSGEEVYAWLDTWGIDNEKPVPECHN